MARHQDRPNRETGERDDPLDRSETDRPAAAPEPIDPTVPVGLWRRVRIRWRHRGEWSPALWTIRVEFEELMAANQWDPAAMIDKYR